MLHQIFNQALDPLSKTMLDNVAGVSLVKFNYHAASKFLDKVTN